MMQVSRVFASSSWIFCHIVLSIPATAGFVLLDECWFTWFYLKFILNSDVVNKLMFWLFQCMSTKLLNNIGLLSVLYCRVNLLGSNVHTVVFGRPFVKRFAVCYQTVVSLSCLSVCNVGVLCPNGWMDQDETWHADRPRPWPHCVTWGPSFPSPKAAQPCPVFGPYPLWANGWMD